MKASYIFSLMPLLASNVFAANDEAFSRVSNDCTEGILSSHNWAAANGTLACGSFIELISVEEAIPAENPQMALSKNARPAAPLVRPTTSTRSSAREPGGLSWSYTVTRTLSAGFGLDSLATISKIISATPSFNLGYQWSEARTEGGSVTCHANPGEPVSHWAQFLMGWSDSQSREVTEILNAQCGSRYSYGPWLGVGRADWPLKGGASQNYGCSAGAAAEC